MPASISRLLPARRVKWTTTPTFRSKNRRRLDSMTPWMKRPKMNVSEKCLILESSSSPINGKETRTTMPSARSGKTTKTTTPALLLPQRELAKCRRSVKQSRAVNDGHLFYRLPKSAKGRWKISSRWAWRGIRLLKCLAMKKPPGA